MKAAGERARERRLVWMLGFGRSGTTWLLHLLCQLPRVDGRDEPLIGAHLGIPTAAALGGMISDGRPLYEVSRAREGYVFSDARRAEWEPALRRLILVALIDKRRPKNLVVVKEPNGSMAAPMIMSVFPRSRMLYVVRDGRDVVDSAVDAWSDGWATKQLGARVGSAEERAALIATVARNWVEVNRTVEAAYDNHAPALRLRVSYEELLADTPGVLGRIASWLGRDVERPRLEAIAEHFAFTAIPEDQRGPGQFVRAAQPGLWREHFDARDRAVLDEIMGPMLAEMGYTPTTAG